MDGHIVRRWTRGAARTVGRFLLRSLLLGERRPRLSLVLMAKDVSLSLASAGTRTRAVALHQGRCRLQSSPGPMMQSARVVHRAQITSRAVLSAYRSAKSRTESACSDSGVSAVELPDVDMGALAWQRARYSTDMALRLRDGQGQVQSTKEPFASSSFKTQA